MLDIIERAYFAELERKTALHTALAFPFSAAVVGITLLGYALQKWPFSGCDNVLLSLPIIGGGGALVAFVINVTKFLIGRHYKYIWTPIQMLDHKRVLDDFCKKFPNAPESEETFRIHMASDLALCATHNSHMNDQRSENLYYANVSALILVLIALGTSIIVVGVAFVRTNYG